ncbi:diaminopropionate ammonia-lyase [Salinicoccus sp. RF5]|uniref:diaminopropionate ammonia-lyase n=1 Tax=Salinicoccus sp. RF5 TaxID=2748874 RepID=UPI001E5342A3|nr:diaminopropionate ammonia-lyase [Salinicoccus sp. RF5]MCC4723375.1 diaminopropionate ammonia-lyase [Salinicoccus sp. RF5]
MDLAWNGFRKKRIESALLEHFDPERLEAVKMFHESVPGYDETPLVHLDNLAESMGVGNIFVKDESKRFGLNAFKGLGGIYAVAEYFRNHERIEFDGFDGLLSALENRPPVTFATATDGNHGKGLAWAASLLGQQAKVFMPEGSEASRLEAIRELGAEAEIMNLNYDDTVERVAALAEEHGWVLVQDTAWPGYEEIPLSIMKGYTTIITEVQSQLGKNDFHGITHVFLQAGVGSFAGAMAAALFNLTGGEGPTIVVVEPDQADCFQRSIQNPSGDPQRVTGALDTMMAGLACGEPSIQGWEILKASADAFISCGDETSARGMRLLGRPEGDDQSIVSGESGAVPFGAFHRLMTEEEYQEESQRLGLDDTSNVLFISTEGDTDAANYERVMTRRL